MTSTKTLIQEKETTEQGEKSRGNEGKGHLIVDSSHFLRRYQEKPKLRNPHCKKACPSAFSGTGSTETPRPTKPSHRPLLSSLWPYLFCFFDGPNFFCRSCQACFSKPDHHLSRVWWLPDGSGISPNCSTPSVDDFPVKFLSTGAWLCAIAACGPLDETGSWSESVLLSL